MASAKLSSRPLFIISTRVRTPHSGGVRTMFLVASPPFWTMPSPLPISCSMKSLNGWITLLPKAAGTVNSPALMTVPAGAGLIDGVGQIEQAALWNKASPGSPAGGACGGPGGGGAALKMGEDCDGGPAHSWFATRA